MKKLLPTIMFVLCLSSGLFLSGLFSNSTAHAASPPTIKQTTIIPLSASACNILLKSDRRLTKRDCTETLTSTTIKSSSFTDMTANGCPSGYVSHNVNNSGITWKVELDTQFHFPGNCTRPSVTYISCLNNMESFWPFSISNASCTSTAIDSSREIAEGVWNVSGILNAGSFTVTVQSIANSNGAISDAHN